MIVVFPFLADHNRRTMTENLRVLDEVGALRAIVDTMRLRTFAECPATALTG